MLPFLWLNWFINLEHSLTYWNSEQWSDAYQKIIFLLLDNMTILNLLTYFDFLSVLSHYIATDDTYSFLLLYPSFFFSRKSCWTSYMCLLFCSLFSIFLNYFLSNFKLFDSLLRIGWWYTSSIIDNNIRMHLTSYTHIIPYLAASYPYFLVR